MKSPRSNFSLGQRLSYPYCETRRMQSEEEQPNRLNGISRNLGAQLSNGRVSHRNSWESYADPLFRTDQQIGALTIPGSRKPCVTTGIFAAMNRSSFGLWREDGLQPDEVYERVWDIGDRLAKWLNRMMEGVESSVEKSELNSP